MMHSDHHNRVQYANICKRKGKSRKHYKPPAFLIFVSTVLGILAISGLQERTVIAAAAQELSTEGSDGLDFSLYTEEKTGVIGYGVTGIGSCEDTDIVVPQARISYFGDILPYLWDDESGFRGMEKVRSVTLPEGALEVRSGFGYSPNLEWVCLPSTIRYIGQGILEYCPKFREIRYNGTVEQWQSIEKSEEWLMGWYNVDQFDIICTDGVINGDRILPLEDEVNVLSQESDADPAPGRYDQPYEAGDISIENDFVWFYAGGFPKDGTRLDQLQYLGGHWKCLLRTNVKVDDADWVRYILTDAEIQYMGFKVTMLFRVYDRYEYPANDPLSHESVPVKEGVTLTFQGDWNPETAVIDVESLNSSLVLRIRNFAEADGVQYGLGSICDGDIEIGHIALVRSIDAG